MGGYKRGLGLIMELLFLSLFYYYIQMDNSNFGSVELIFLSGVQREFKGRSLSVLWLSRYSIHLV